MNAVGIVVDPEGCFISDMLELRDEFGDCVRSYLDVTNLGTYLLTSWLPRPRVRL